MTEAAARLHAPATLRNRDPLLAVLRSALPPTGLVLEVASGTGEHVAFFAQHLPGLAWQPSDTNAEARVSIDAHAAGLPRVRPAIDLDAAASWPPMRADAVLCVNMIHIAPWPATLGLCAGASAALAAGGPLVLYGPFIDDGPTSPSNLEFDASLRARDPAWGLRRLDDVSGAAAGAGFGPPDVISMPANNLALVFRRASV